MVLTPAKHETSALPCFRSYDGVSFPLCVCPTENEAGAQLREDATELSKWAKVNAVGLEALLSRHGALLFRGFGAANATAETFASFVENGIQLPNFPYSLGNAVRTAVVSDRVFTANEAPPDRAIPWHHELAQTPSYPDRILFFCEEAPPVGGETPIVLSTAIYEALKKAHPQFVQRLEATGVVYSRVMTPHDRPHSAIGRGWRGTFGAQSRTDVEKKLSARGYSWEWLGEGEDALLREISPKLDAVKEVAEGKRAFFNQIVAVWGGWRDEYNTPEQCVRHADGTAFNATTMADAEKIMAEHRVAIPWQNGDILYIDNMQVQHSRAPFEGKRRVLASLAYAPRSM